MRSNRLQLNASKTEVLWCASARRQSQLPFDPLTVGSDLVSPVSCVRDLGIFIDADLTMRTQVSQTCSKCFAALRQLRSIRRSVSNDVMQSLIVALVFSRLDYGSATLAGLPKQLMDRLQSVQNAADLQCLSSGPHSAVTAQIALASDARTRFVSAGSASVSLPPRLCTWLPGRRSSARHTSTHVDDCALRLHQRWSFHALCVLPLATAPFQRLLHRSGTVCRSRSGHRRRCKFSAAD